MYAVHLHYSTAHYNVVSPIMVMDPKIKNPLNLLVMAVVDMYVYKTAMKQSQNRKVLGNCLYLGSPYPMRKKVKYRYIKFI